MGPNIKDIEKTKDFEYCSILDDIINIFVSTFLSVSMALWLYEENDQVFRSFTRGEAKERQPVDLKLVSLSVFACISAEAPGDVGDRPSV